MTAQPSIEPQVVSPLVRGLCLILSAAESLPQAAGAATARMLVPTTIQPRGLLAGSFQRYPDGSGFLGRDLPIQEDPLGCNRRSPRSMCLWWGKIGDRRPTLFHVSSVKAGCSISPGRRVYPLYAESDYAGTKALKD